MAGDKQPLVSIIIPAYNAGRYLKGTIESILSQTYKNWEIIVGVGHSTDDTQALLDEYAKKGLITCVMQTGKGPADARNIAMRAARGEFIMFLDADDISLPERIEKQVDFFKEHPECDVCYCDIKHFYDDDPKNLLKLDYHYYSGADVLPRLLEKNFIAPSTVMMRKSVADRIGLYDESFLRSEDWEYWVRLAYHGAVFKFLPEVLLHYRLHRGSYSYGWNVKRAEKETTLRIFKELRREMPTEERKKYHLDKIVFRNRLKLWYIILGNYFPPLQWLYQWNQRRRLK